VEG
ncbi:hypothetical protein HaLaN_25926, partial [Haematococcus lacustris]|jgi:hypothetical protein